MESIVGDLENFLSKNNKKNKKLSLDSHKGSKTMQFAFNVQEMESMMNFDIYRRVQQFVSTIVSTQV